MKHGKKILTVLSAVAIAVSMSVPAFAYTSTHVQFGFEHKNLEENFGRVPIRLDDPVNLPPISFYDVTHLPGEQHTGSEYKDSFTCTPEDGNRLNIFVRNDGASTVYLNITWKDGNMEKAYPAVEIPAGKQNTQTFSYEDNAGINGRWTVEVTTKSGHSLNVWVSARQYQINP